MFPESFCDPFQEDADNAPRASPTRTQKKKAPRRKNQKDSAQAPKPPAQNQKKKTIKNSQKKRRQMMVAKYQWKGQRNDDLSFKKGDLISVVERCEDPGWLIGEVIRDDEEDSSVRGMFPESYCELVLEDTDSAPRAPKLPTQKKKATRKKSRSPRGEGTRNNVNVNCRRFRNQYVKERLVDKRQKLGLSIKTCQQAHTNKLLANLETGENVKFYWDVDNLYTMESDINGKRRDSKFKSEQDSIPLPKYTTKWFPGIINIRPVRRRDGKVYIEILVHDDDTYKRIRLPDSNYVYEYYDGYLNPRYNKQQSLTWSIDFRRIERESIVTLCINPKHVMANSHWYGLPWVTDIWERSLPIRLESN